MKKKRATLPKAIAAAFKSGDKAGAMDMAIYQREANNVTELARRFKWLFKVQSCKDKAFRDAVANHVAPSRERVGDLSGPPAKRHLDKKVKNSLIKNWCDRELNSLKAKVQIGMARSENFEAELEREFKRVCNDDSKVKLFDKPGIKKSEKNNPNWFRQILIANLRLKESNPLFRLAKKIGIDVRVLRREARRLGAKQGKAGKPYLS